MALWRGSIRSTEAWDQVSILGIEFEMLLLPPFLVSISPNSAMLGSTIALGTGTSYPP